MKMWLQMLRGRYMLIILQDFYNDCRPHAVYWTEWSKIKDARSFQHTSCKIKQHLQDSYWYAARGKYLQMKMPFNVVQPSSCKSGFDQYSGQLVENIVDQEATSVCEGALSSPCRFSQLPILTAIKWNVTMMASKPQLGLEPTKCSEDENKYS